MKNKYKHSCLAIVLILLSASCINEDDFDMDRLAETHLKPTVENNIIYTEFKLSDFFNFESLKDEGNGVDVEFLKTYGDEHDSIILTVNKEMNILDDEFDFISELQLEPVELGIGTMDLSFIQYIPITPGSLDTVTLIDWADADIMIEAFEPDEQGNPRHFDSIILESGMVTINVPNLPMVTQFQLHSTSIRTSDREYLDTIISIGQGVTQIDLDFSNYDIEITPLNDGSGNYYVDLDYKIFLDLNSMDLSSLPSSCNFDISLTFGDKWDVSLAYGQIGYNEYQLLDTVYIDYFDNSDFKDLLPEGTLDLKGMTMQMWYQTNIGLDGSLDISSMHAMNYEGSDVSLFKNPPHLEILRAASPLQANLSGYFSNEQLGGVNERAIEILPNLLIYDVKYAIFDHPSTESFVYPTKSYLNVNLGIRAPFAVKINDMTSINDIDDFSFLQDDGGIGDYLDSTILRFDVENTFPATLEINIMFKNNNGDIVDSLLTTPLLISAAKVNNEGKIISASKEIKESIITSEKYQQLRQAEKIAIKAVLNSATLEDNSKPHVLFEKESTLKLKIGVKAQMDIAF